MLKNPYVGIFEWIWIRCTEEKKNANVMVKIVDFTGMIHMAS